MTAGKPRVLIATRLFTPEVGAAAFRLQALADGLRQQNVDTRVITTKPPRSVRNSIQNTNVRVFRLPVLRDRSGNVRGYLEYLSFDIPLFFRLLFRHADIVVAEPPPTTGLVVAITSWLRRRPFAYYAADVWSDGLVALSAPRVLIRVMKGVEGFAMRRASAIISVSNEVATRVEKFGIERKRITVVGNGVDTTVFSLAKVNVLREKALFVYAGTMSEWQGAEIFVNAISRVRERHPDARLTFLGHGTDENNLREVAKQFGGNVTFEGVVSPIRAAQSLRVATAAVVSIKPGAGYDFAKPTKIYAAAACGTPVIFAGAETAASVVTDNGLGVSTSYTVDAVAEAMCQMIDEQASGMTDKKSFGRSVWATQHASVAASGLDAAGAVLAISRSEV